jgi:hypothetical protein
MNLALELPLRDHVAVVGDAYHVKTLRCVPRYQLWRSPPIRAARAPSCSGSVTGAHRRARPGRVRRNRVPVAEARPGHSYMIPPAAIASIPPSW